MLRRPLGDTTSSLEPDGGQGRPAHAFLHASILAITEHVFVWAALFAVSDRESLALILPRIEQIRDSSPFLHRHFVRYSFDQTQYLLAASQ
jgi:hypothetical protein